MSIIYSVSKLANHNDIQDFIEGGIRKLVFEQISNIIQNEVVSTESAQKYHGVSGKASLGWFISSIHFFIVQHPE